MATLGSVLLAALCACMCVYALGAPLHAVRDLDYGASRSLVLKLNQQARQLYEKVEAPKEEAVITDPPLMIRPEDRCDPESLQENPETCLSRVALALKNYSRIFGDTGLFLEQNTNCNKWRINATTVAQLTKQLLDVLKEPSEDPDPLIVDSWMAEGLCRDSVERLYSFSIITARIFSYLHSLQPKLRTSSG